MVIDFANCRLKSELELLLKRAGAMSIIDILTKGKAPQSSGQPCSPHAPHDCNLRRAFADIDAYVADVKKDIDTGRLKLQGNPTITPVNPFGVAAGLTERIKHHDGGVTGGDAMQGGRVFSRVGVGRWTTHPQGGQVS